MANTDAIYLEFPFLGNIVPRTKVSQAAISRWDSKFLQEGSLNAREGISWVDEIHLLDKEGNVISIVGKRTGWEFFTKFGWLQSDGWYNLENVGQSIARIKEKAGLVRYAIQFKGTSFTLYKLPKGFSNATEWLLSKAETARNQMRQDH